MPFKGKSDIDFALNLATAIALRQLHANPGIPRLYKSGVRWKRDVCRARSIPGACERFLSPLDVLAEGGVGDCDDLVPWRTAEMILFDADLKARGKAIDAPGIGYHVICQRGDGSREDPSKRLGMGKG